MNIDLNDNEYPRLVPPQVVYEGKDALKKQSTVIPLLVKITSVAAAVALLVGLFWRQNSTPTQEMVAELKPVEMLLTSAEEPLRTSGDRAHFSIPRKGKKTGEETRSISSGRTRKERPAAVVTMEREAMPMIAALTPYTVTALDSYGMAAIASSTPQKNLADAMGLRQMPWDEDLSLARKSLLVMTDGEYDNIGSMILNGWRSFKTELAQINNSVTNDIAALKQNDRP